jgi:hypothetical protein
MCIDIGLSSLSLRNFYKYRLLFHGFLHQLEFFFFSIDSSMIPLYLFRNSFSIMVYTLIYGPFGILLEVFTPLLIWRKFNKLVVQYFYKDLGATDNPKFNELKNPKSSKSMISGNMPRQNCPWSQIWGRTQCYRLNWEEEPY